MDKITSYEQYIDVYGVLSGVNVCQDTTTIKGLVNQENVNLFKYSVPITAYLGIEGDNTFHLYRDYSRFHYSVYKGIDLDTLPKLSNLTHLVEGVYGIPVYHFPHLNEDQTKVAFTPNFEKGQADIQVVMKIGRYLTKYSNLDEDTIRDIVTEFNAKYSAIEINIEPGMNAKKVYLMESPGFSSCMDASHFKTHMEVDEHPAKVYGTDDIDVAYTTKTDKEGNVTLSGRCLINKAEKQYTRVYGDPRLGLTLQGMGYTLGDLCGCRLLKINDGSHSRYLMPYLDGDNRISDEGDHWLVGSGDYEAEGVEGYLNVGRWCNIHEEHTEEDVSYVEDYGNVCCECLSDQFHRIDGTYYHDDCVITDAHNNAFLEEGIGNTHIFIDYHSDWYPNDECTTSQLTYEPMLITDEVVFELDDDTEIIIASYDDTSDIDIDEVRSNM